MMARGAEWVMEKEEERASSECIPESARVRLTRVMINQEKQSMMLQCVRRLGGMGLKESALEWEETVINGW